MRDIGTVLRTEHGLNVTGSTLNYPTGISDDKKTIVGIYFGSESSSGWAVLLDKPLVTLGLPGDYNNNGLVEQADLDLVLLNWGAIGATPPSGWYDNLPSGLIDQQELDAVLLNWGSTVTPASAATAAIPEPCTAMLLFIGLLAVAVSRRLKQQA
jgi:hypothetical protein